MLLLFAYSIANPELRTAYWIDETGSASLEDALAAAERGAFTSYEDLLLRGYVANPVWFRLDLPAGVRDGEDWVLRVRPSWHDELRLYDPFWSGVEPRVTGDRYSTRNDAYESLNLTFVIPQPSEPRTLMLRLDTPHGLIFEARLLPEAEARRLDQRQFGWFMAYLGLIVIVLVSTVAAWWRDREPLLGVGSINIGLGIAYGMSMYGVLRLLLEGVVGNETLNTVNDLLILAYPLSAMVLYRVFLRYYRVRRFARAALDLLIALEALALVAVVAGYSHEAFFWNAVIMVIGLTWVLLSLWLWAGAAIERSSDGLPFWMVRWVATALLGFIIFGLLTGTLGFPVDWGARIEAFLLHTSFMSIVLSVSLQYRSRRRQRALEAAEQRAEFESAERARLQRFMNMFSHEVRTPLSIVSLAVEGGIRDSVLASQARSAIVDLDQLVSKSLQVDRLESKAVVQEREEVDLLELVEDCALRLDLSDALRWAGAHPTWVRVDVYLTHVIVTNLLENAHKYGVAEAGIDVELVGGVVGTVTLLVGNRIDAAGAFDPQQVFDKYYRSESAVRRSGAGLGLYLARSFARMQGGDLRLDHHSQTYVRFALVLPA